MQSVSVVVHEQIIEVLIPVIKNVEGCAWAFVMAHEAKTICNVMWADQREKTRHECRCPLDLLRTAVHFCRFIP